jgi:hypothetical protein
MAKRRPPALPRARARDSRWRWLRRPSTFIIAFLAVQMLLPLSYYLGRRDRYDERWAWRMYSPERMVHCQPRFLLGDHRKEVDLLRNFHEDWKKLAERGRLGVVERMALSLCDRNPGQAVRVELRCRELDGTQSDLTEGYDVCLLGVLK